VGADGRDTTEQKKNSEDQRLVTVVATDLDTVSRRTPRRREEYLSSPVHASSDQKENNQGTEERQERKLPVCVGWSELHLGTDMSWKTQCSSPNQRTKE